MLVKFYIEGEVIRSLEDMPPTDALALLTLAERNGFEDKDGTLFLVNDSRVDLGITNPCLDIFLRENDEVSIIG